MRATAPQNGNSGFAFSSAMFPSVVDGAARTMLQINAASEAIATLADASGKDAAVVCVLHSIPSGVLGQHAFGQA